MLPKMSTEDVERPFNRVGLVPLQLFKCQSVVNALKNSHGKDTKKFASEYHLKTVAVVMYVPWSKCIKDYFTANYSDKDKNQDDHD